MSSNYQRIKHKRSGVKGKRPTPDILGAGEVSLNYNAEQPGLFISTSADTIAKIGPVYIGDEAPNAYPPSGGYAYHSHGEQWMDDNNRILRVYNETAGEWQDVLSPLAAQSKYVITVSQDSEYATDAMSNNGKVRPFKTLQRALLQVARESIATDPTTSDSNYTVYVAPGHYSVPNKGTSTSVITVDISSNRYGDSTVGLPVNATATIRFTFSAEPASFDLSMVTAQYGTLTNLTQNSNFNYIYTAEFTRTDATNYGIITISDGAFISKDGVGGVGAALNLATTAQTTTAVPIYEREDDYVPTDEDYERINVNEGIIIPRGTCIVGANQRSVFFTGNYNSKDQDRTAVFKATQQSQVRDITVIDKPDSGLVVQDEALAQLNRIRFTEPHGLRTGDVITFSRFSGADIYSPLVYGKQYNIGKIDDYVVELYVGDRKVSLVDGSAAAVSGVVAKYSVDPSNLTLVNVHGFELASNAELTTYYGRVASELYEPGTTVYTTPESWESEAVAPLTTLGVDSVRKGSVYFRDVSVRSKYGMSGWLIDGAKNTGLKSAHLASCTLVSLQTDPNAWEVFNAVSGVWEAPAGTTTDEKRQAIIDSALNGIRVKTPRNSDGTVDSDNDNRFFLVCATNNAFVSTFSCFAIGASDHYLALNGGNISAHSSTSNFGGVGLVSEGFAGMGTTGGALPQDTGWFIEGVLRPLQVDVSEAADAATAINLGVAITEVLENDGASTDVRLTTDNIAVGETAIYLDKSYSDTVPLPFSLIPSSAIYINVGGTFYRAMVTADPFITDTNGAVVGFRTSSTNNAILSTGNTVVGEDLFIRRFVDSRSDLERNPQILIQGKDQQPVQKNTILRLSSGGRGSNGTQLIKQGVQIDPVLNSDSSQVYEVVDFVTRDLGENPNEVLRSFNNVFAPTNEFYVTVQQNGEFGAWDSGQNYVRGDIVSYGEKNYMCVSPSLGGPNPDVSPYWLNAQVSQQGVSHLNTISSIGLTVTVINKDDGTRSMGITDDDLNPTYHPVQRAVRKFLALLGMNSADIITVLRPETRANRLFTVNDMLAAGMQLTGAGFATQIGTWPIEFNRPSTVSALSHSWDSCGYWNYSTALPALRDSQLTSREELDFLYSEALGGHVFATGLTESNEAIFSSLYRDLYSGGLYDLRSNIGDGGEFTVSTETTDQEVFFGPAAPSSPRFGTLWIDSSASFNTLKFWDGGAWVVANEGQVPSGTVASRPADPTAGDLFFNTGTSSLEYYTGATWADVSAVDSFNGRTGAVVPTEGDYSLGLLGDVDTTGATIGQILKYDGTQWVPAVDDDTIYTLPSATETVVGGAEVATQAETDAGTDDTRIVTPAKLSGYTTNVLDTRYSASGSGVLSFNGRGGAVVPTEGDYNLGELGDVNTTGAVSGQVLKYNGTQWVPQADNDTLPTVTVAAVPTASTDPGNAGDVACDANFFYWYDGARWQRVAADATVW